jgi:hypothetical protein
MACFEEVSRIHPNDYHNKGNALRQLRRYEEALFSYNEAIRLNSFRLSFRRAFSRPRRTLVEFGLSRIASLKKKQCFFIASEIDDNESIPFTEINSSIIIRIDSDNFVKANQRFFISIEIHESNSFIEMSFGILRINFE